MSGFKHRYLLLQIKSRGGQSFGPTLKSILMNGLRDDFGDYIMGKIDYFEVCEYYDALGVAIVRCNLDVYKYLCYVIVTKGQLGKLQVGMRILFTSGVLKKAKRAYLAHLASAKAPSALPAEP